MARIQGIKWRLAAVALSLCCVSCSSDPADDAGLVPGDSSHSVTGVNRAQGVLTEKLPYDCDFDSTVESALREASSRPAPPPEPGFGVAISSSFEDMLDQAPPLDSTDATFHEGDAAFWHEQFGKAYSVGLLLTSEDFQKLVVDARANAAGQAIQDPLAAFRSVIDQLESFKPHHKHDRFAIDFTLSYYSDWMRIGEIMLEVEARCGELEAGVSREVRADTVKAFRERGDEIRRLIYRPSPTPEDIARRRALSTALVQVSSRLEHVLEEEAK